MSTKSSHRSTAQTKQDHESIIGTNNSSIVSKRSVERLYHPEPHFFRYFVKKPQRRSPLINRGYWLRMHAIDHVVHDFLNEPSEKTKLILNLGCGYDPLPFQWLAKARELCRNTVFVDVDYPQLIARKADIIAATPELHGLLPNISRNSGVADVPLSSEKYHAIGCDLGDVGKLETLLSKNLDISQCMVLCTAEVSITYMESEPSDRLISWAASHSDMRFCLLEQFLPAGPEHPFAVKMIQHFENLHTPLRSIFRYPSLAHQTARFKQRGWTSVSVKSLWDIWRDPTSVSAEKRRAVDAAEPFDEWEEFILFASHYFLLVASTSTTGSNDTLNPLNVLNNDSQTLGVPSPQRSYRKIDLRHPNPDVAPYRRRFGTTHISDSRTIAFLGGLDAQKRTNGIDLFNVGQDPSAKEQHSRPGIFDHLQIRLTDRIEPRMCHTVTRLVTGQVLLAGGRASPDRPLADCWLFEERWNKVQDLPVSLYRHCAVAVRLSMINADDSGIVVLGGKTSGNALFDQYHIWRKSTGWEQLQIRGVKPAPSFGGSAVSTDTGAGLFFGGVTADGVLQPDFWHWTVHHHDGRISLDFTKVEMIGWPKADLYARVGAQLIESSHHFILIGGVGNYIYGAREDIVELEKQEPLNEGQVWYLTCLETDKSAPRSLLVGHSACALGGVISIVGGGAVCFSFGAFWNVKPVTFSLTANHELYDLRLIVPEKRILGNGDNADHRTSGNWDSTLKGLSTSQGSSPVISGLSTSGTHDMFVAPTLNALIESLRSGKPAVLRRGLSDFSEESWSPTALQDKIGAEREIMVHKSNGKQMDFLQRNFIYERVKFSDFMDDILQGSPQYLRSLSNDKPSLEPANIASGFPELAPDFTLPEELSFVGQRMHSSILRISGMVNMWLHYDVMANVLCQTFGSKRLLLFPPSDISCFAIPPGSSSSSINVFEADARTKHPALAESHPHEARLGPGDILYIPPLWLHTAAPLGRISVSVNVFFRNLEKGYAPGRDVYGNRDVQAYEKGRTDLQKLVKSFDQLPRHMTGFYLERLADELKVIARQYASTDGALIGLAADLSRRGFGEPQHALTTLRATEVKFQGTGMQKAAWQTSRARLRRNAKMPARLVRLLVGSDPDNHQFTTVFIYLWFQINSRP